MDNLKIIEEVKVWIEKIVIGLNLCPFASHPFRNNLIKYQLSSTSHLEAILEEVTKEFEYLLSKKKEEVETCIIILKNGFDDFEAYLELYYLAEELLIHFENKLQLASFHPNYQFEEEDIDDKSNYSNRSPYPLIHILRTESVSHAVDNYDDVNNIPLNNKDLLNTMSNEEFDRLFGI